ncbi:MAG: hypothetical protein JXR83_21050 [Deltaproteobacteria bacterium]|nr:hypothetical protein [Deltaproteobacteria bacterium]
MIQPEAIENLLPRLAIQAQRALAARWLDRALRVHVAALLEAAGDGRGATLMQRRPAIAGLAGARRAQRTLHAVFDRVTRHWRQAVARAQRGSTGWRAVLDLLGPDQVTPWAALLAVADELEYALSRPTWRERAAVAAALASAAAAGVAALRAGGTPRAVEQIAEAVADEERARQKKELLDLLPL